MDRKIIDFLRTAFPFVLTLFLWRASIGWLNPAGLLVLVPVFFCTFIRPTAWFVPFGVLMCFLVDYRADTLLFWTSVYCLAYAVCGFQNVVDLTRADNDGIGAFALFFCVSVLIISLPHMVTFTNVFRVLWTGAWECAMYFPLVALIKRVGHD